MCRREGEARVILPSLLALPSANAVWLSAFPWFALAAFATVLFLMFLSWRRYARREERHRRLSYGRCVHCGYDRRGTKSILCPECGK